MPSRYDPLRRELETQDQSFSMTFAELEDLVGPLPPSASIRQWWANTGKGQSKSWVDAGFIVDSVDLSGGVVVFAPGAPRRRPGGSRGSGSARRRQLILDGAEALDEFLTRAGWSGVAAALAAHTVFLGPATVAQTGGRALLPIVRDPVRRGQFGRLDDGRQVLFDDNTTPTDVFLWAAGRKKGPDVQFNHVWTCAFDPDSYTALWNLCCTPAFLAKATDTHPEAVAAMQYRAYDLYGCVPVSEAVPQKPAGYDELRWADSPAPIDDLEGAIRARMRTAPRRRATQCAVRLGWLFSDGPDETLIRAGGDHG